MNRYLISVILFSLITGCYSQDNERIQYNPRLIGNCEGCEAVFEFGDRLLSPIDTLPDFGDEGPKLKISGTIYLPDGKTPAPNVVLYVYHTDQTGVYPTKGDETGWARRHGYIRGWIKTGAEGTYTFYTLRPATYPNRAAPAHIHPIVLEPDGKYYWLGSYLFNDDPLLSDPDHTERSIRGGNDGIMTLGREDNIWVGERNIVLGKNIPGYK